MGITLEEGREIRSYNIKREIIKILEEILITEYTKEPTKQK